LTVTTAVEGYGTLTDTHGVVEKRQGVVGVRARNFSSSWRDRQDSATTRGRRGLLPGRFFLARS
jgi:hypothetical protein